MELVLLICSFIVMQYFVFYIILYLMYSAFVYFLIGIRASLPIKTRSTLDDEIATFTLLQKNSIIWPYILYTLVKEKLSSK